MSLTLQLRCRCATFLNIFVRRILQQQATWNQFGDETRSRSPTVPGHDLIRKLELTVGVNRDDLVLSHCQIPQRSFEASRRDHAYRPATRQDLPCILPKWLSCRVTLVARAAGATHRRRPVGIA